MSESFVEYLYLGVLKLGRSKINISIPGEKWFAKFSELAARINNPTVNGWLIKTLALVT